MEFLHGGDIVMHEDDVINSTEQQPLFSQSIADISPKSQKDDELYESSQKQALRGDGLKREASIFDYPLTKDKPAPRPAKFSALPYASSQTGLVYDVRMRFHVEPEQSEDDLHPEDPRRIHAIFESFADAGLAWRQGANEPAHDFYMGRIDTRLVTREEVCLVHTRDHWNWVQDLINVPEDLLVKHQQHPGSGMDSVYMSRQTPFCAALSAGGAIEGT